MTTLATLPDLCLLRIFDYLALDELATLDQVCPRFGTLQAEAHTRRGRLTVHIGNCSESQLSDPNCQTLPRREYVINEEGVPIQVGIIHLNTSSKISVSLPELRLEISSQLLETFSTKVKSLEVICNQVSLDSIDPALVDLLCQLGPQLVELKLHFGQIRKCTDSCGDFMSHKLRTFHRLFSILNSDQFPLLKKLSFQYRGLLCDQVHPRIDLPILSQLEEFVFECGENVAKSLDLLNRVRSEGLQKIALGNRVYYKDIIKSYWLDIPASIAQNFTYLEVYHYDCHYSLLQSLFDIYHSLTTLSLTFSLSTFPIGQLAASLAPLSKLQYLRLTIFIREFGPVLDIQPVEQAIASVKVLVLTFADKEEHEVFQSFHLEQLFPNVQILKFVLTENCEDASESDCTMKLAARFIENCTKLKKVYKRDVLVWKRN